MPHPKPILYVALATFALFGSLFLVCQFAPVVNQWINKKQVKQDLDVEKSNFESRKLCQKGDFNSEESLPSGSLAKMISGLSFKCSAPFVPVINAVTSMPLSSSLLYSSHRKVVPLLVKQHHLSIPAFREDFIPVLKLSPSRVQIFIQANPQGVKSLTENVPPHIFIEAHNAILQMLTWLPYAIHAKKFAIREISGLAYYGGYKTGVQRSAYTRAYFGTISSRERPH
ncbi:hypothetical protein EV368DRAFT_82230 [Lentinula lateritia]|nr:hypothetical protein EV368DRAFT_82230 [Lentinula lateritia]